MVWRFRGPPRPLANGHLAVGTHRRSPRPVDSYRLFYKTIGFWPYVISPCPPSVVLHEVLITGQLGSTPDGSRCFLWAPGPPCRAARAWGAGRRVQGLWHHGCTTGGSGTGVGSTVPTGWHGNEPGQFAFVTSDVWRGARYLAVHLEMPTPAHHVHRRVGAHTATEREVARRPDRSCRGTNGSVSPSEPRCAADLGGRRDRHHASRPDEVTLRTVASIHSVIDLSTASADADETVFGS